MATLSELLTRALQVYNEQVENMNSNVRIGSLFRDIVDFLNTKQDKESGKGLSTNDFSNIDKANLDTLVNMLNDNHDNVLDTISEVFKILESYPEGVRVVDLLGGKVDKSDFSLATSTTSSSINDMAKAPGSTEDVFPVKGIYIPSGGLLTRDCSIVSFSCRFVTAEAGRSVKFGLLSKLANGTFKLEYITDAVLAENTGRFDYTLPSTIAAKSGWYIGCFSNPILANNSLSYYGTGGNLVDYYGGWRIGNVTSGIVGDIFTDIVAEEKGRGFPVSAKVNMEITRAYSRLNNWTDKKILWVGTSIPAGNESAYKSYPLVVGDMLEAKVDNEAMGSSGIIWDGTRGLSLSATRAELTTAFGAAYADQSYETKIIGKNADLLVLDHGYNDRNQASGTRLGTIDSTDRSTFYGAFNYVIQAAIEDNPDLKLLFVTPPNRYDWAPMSVNVQVIDNVREAIFSIAKKYNAPVCDLALLSNINGYNFNVYKSDGTHPKGEDRQRLGYILAEFIKRMA